MSLNRIINAEGQEEQVLEAVKDAGLIATSIKCGPCGGIAMKWSVYRKAKDGYAWRCGKCKASPSVKLESFFYQSHISFPNWMRFFDHWLRHEEATAEQLQVAANVEGEKTPLSMLAAARSMCDRVVFDDDASFPGGPGVPVAVIPTGSKCNGGHDLLLIWDGTNQNVIHRDNPIPIKANSTIFTDVPGFQPNSCVVHNYANCQLQNVGEIQEVACRWLRRKRGIACTRATGICGEYTYRRKYISPDDDPATYGDIFLRHLREIYAPLLANLQYTKN